MVFSDTINLQGIVQDIDFRVNTNATKFSIADKTRIINRIYEQVVGDILSTDGRWQWDDTNYTNYPIATTDLVSGQQDYVYDPKHIRVTRMEIKDPDGKWHWLEPIDQNDERYKSLTELGTNQGVPKYYDKLSNSVFLYPTPNYSQLASLKVYYQRNASLFVASDTTKEPGFASPFHRILSVGASLEYAVANNLNAQKISLLRDEYNKLTNELKEFYSKKSKDEQLRLSVRRHSFR